MQDQRQTTIVGVFVTMGLVVLGGLIMAFGGGRTLFTRTYDLHVVFEKGVQGIQEGQAVTLFGKRIGITKSVEFVQDANLEKGVRLIVSVEGFELPEKCEMQVSPNLMGIGKPPINIVITDPTDSRRLPMDGTAEIKGKMLPVLDQLIPVHMQQTFQSAADHIGELAATLKPAAENLARLMEARAMQDVDEKHLTATLDTVIQRFDVTLQSLNAIVGDPGNQENIRVALANAREISESTAKTMEHVREISADVGRDMNKLLSALASGIDDMSTLLRRLDQTVAMMQQKTGTVGRLLNDDRLYEELLLTARRMTSMLEELREVLDQAKQGKLRIKAF